MRRPVRHVRTAVAFCGPGPRTRRRRCTAITRRTQTRPCTLPAFVVAKPHAPPKQSISGPYNNNHPRSQQTRADGRTGVRSRNLRAPRPYPLCPPSHGRSSDGFGLRRDVYRAGESEKFVFFSATRNDDESKFRRDSSTNFIGPRVLSSVRDFRGEKPKRASVSNTCSLK